MSQSQPKQSQLNTGQTQNKVPQGQIQAELICFQITVYLISEDKNQIDCHIVNAEDSLTLAQCAIILQDKLKKPMSQIEYRTTLESQLVKGETQIKNYAKGPESELYIFYKGLKPIIKELEKQIKYKSLTKYSFLEDKKVVKVYIDLEGVGDVPADKITSRFLDRSFEIKIHDLKGENYIFAVPKTQCAVETKRSKLLVKKDKLIISLGKVAEADNWFSLYKTKMVGDKDAD